MINTEDVVLSQKTLEANPLRNQNICIFWNDLAGKEIAENPLKLIKYLTDHYIDYLATKLNCLCVKSTDSDCGDSLYSIFHTHTMSELFNIYVKILNSHTDKAKVDQERKEINKLFKLLEHDYNSQYHRPMFTNAVIKESPTKEKRKRKIAPGLISSTLQ